MSTPLVEVRALWRPGEAPGWTTEAGLAAAARQVAREPVARGIAGGARGGRRV